MSNKTKDTIHKLKLYQFGERTDWVLSLLKGITFEKFIRLKLILAAAVMETADLARWLQEFQQEEDNSYTGCLLRCSPSLQDTIERFMKEHKFIIGFIEFLKMSFIGEDEIRDSFLEKNEIETLQYLVNHPSIKEVASENARRAADENINQLASKFEEEYREGFMSWANGLKPDILTMAQILVCHIDDVLRILEALNATANNPDKLEALAKGLEDMYKGYRKWWWPEEQAKFDLEVARILKKYPEDDEEGIRDALLSFYEGDDWEPLQEDKCFVELWQEHLSKSYTSENFKGLAKEMWWNWGRYKPFFMEEGALERCFTAICYEDYISEKLKELRKAKRKGGHKNVANVEENSSPKTPSELTTKERDEELFHFIHPELGDEEAWRVHEAMKRVVANYRIPDICAYLKEQKQNGKLMLPSNSSFMYNELVRLGMPKGEGFSEKNFSNSYMK